MPKNGQYKVFPNDEPDDRSDGGDKWALKKFNAPRERWEIVSLHRTKQLATWHKGNILS